MGLSWRIGVVVAAASVIFALGLNLALSIILSLATLLILIRREILESLFPLRAYRKNCLSVRGLESDPKFEEQFRNELAAAICQAFPEHKPTACCCIAGGKEILRPRWFSTAQMGTFKFEFPANRFREPQANYSGGFSTTTGTHPSRRLAPTSSQDVGDASREKRTA